jgi:hypothetical protein
MNTTRRIAKHKTIVNTRNTRPWQLLYTQEDDDKEKHKTKMIRKENTTMMIRKNVRPQQP